MANNSSPSVKKNFALSTAYQILILIVPFVTTPYVSRVLGANGVGIYSFTNSIATYFTMFAALGTMSYGAREISRARNDSVLLSRLFWEIEALVVASTLCCLIIWMMWVLLAPEYNVIYLILSMTLMGVVVDVSWFFTGLEQFKYIVIRNSIVKIIGVIMLFVFICEKSDLTLYIFLMTIINLVGALSMWMYIPKMVDRIDWHTIELKKHFKETLVYFIPTIATSIYTILNKVLLGFMGGDIRENGYYEQATRIVAVGQTLTFAALNSVMGARIAYLFAEQRIDEIHQRIDKSLHYILLVGLAMTMGLIAIAPRFVPWFMGPGFEPTIILIQLLSPIILVIGVSNCLGAQYYNPAGLRKQSAQYIIVGATVNLIINLILIPPYGAVGAIIGSLMAELTITGLYLWNCNGFITFHQILVNGWRKTVSAFVMFLSIMYVSSLFEDDTIYIIISCFVGIIIYALMLMLMHDKFTLDILSMSRKRMLKR